MAAVKLQFHASEEEYRMTTRQITSVTDLCVYPWISIPLTPHTDSAQWRLLRQVRQLCSANGLVTDYCSRYKSAWVCVQRFHDSTNGQL